MGREIRRVPPNWQHPKTTRYGKEGYQPLFDEPYIDAITEWIKGHQEWELGTHKDLAGVTTKQEYPYFANWNGNAPDVEYYRPNWNPEEATWYQVYETVSEGTPVTPPFATREQLVEYLVANGDFWDQSRREDGTSSMPCSPWPRKNAEAFVFGSGWAPTLVIENGKCMVGGRDIIV